MVWFLQCLPEYTPEKGQKNGLVFAMFTPGHARTHACTHAARRATWPHTAPLVGTMWYCCKYTHG